MKIRKGSKKDARKISLLRRNAIKKINAQDYSKEIVDLLLKSNDLENTFDKIKKEETFCLWNKELLIGTVSLEKDIVGGLYIKISKMKKGFAKQLMDFIENYAKRKGWKKLRLYPTKTAYIFYKKLGYKRTGKMSCWKILGNDLYRDGYSYKDRAILWKIKNKEIKVPEMEKQLK